jgi:hypothetical protein
MDIRVIKTEKKFLVSIISDSSVLGVFEKSSQMTPDNRRQIQDTDA